MPTTLPDIPSGSIIYVDPEITLAECETQIGRCIGARDRLQWRIVVLLSHIKDNRLYLFITDDEGDSIYSSFKDYLESLQERIPRLSRRTYFERQQILRRMDTLGVPMEDIIDRSPTALAAVTELGQWTRDGTLVAGDAREMKQIIEETKDLPTGEVIARIRDRQGNHKVFFAGDIEGEGQDGLHVSLRGIGKEGDVYFLRGAISSEIATEIARRLGFSWEEDTLPWSR